MSVQFAADLILLQPLPRYAIPDKYEVINISYLMFNILFVFLCQKNK